MNYFTKKVDMRSARKMFEFLKEHFTYSTMNSWNGLKSIANCVKLHHLNLKGKWQTAYNYLQQDNYEKINGKIYDWELEHKYYKCYFNGQSGGYLVLYNKDNNCNVLPDFLDCDTYEDFLDCYEWEIKNYGKKYYFNQLKEYTKLVIEFDKLCDSLRDIVNEYSTCDIANDTIELICESFNINFENELEDLKINELDVKNNKIDINNLQKYRSLMNGLHLVVKSYIEGTFLESKIENNMLSIVA